MKYTSCFMVFCLFVFSLLGCVGPPESNDEQSTNENPQQINRSDGQKPSAEQSSGGTENPAEIQNSEAGFKIQNKKNISVYLPKNVNKTEPLPVIFMFDPSADGDFPVKVYKTLADKFGYALVGSNVSKNGQDLSAGIAIFKQMKNEFATMQAIDEKRVYTIGFSGGARVAASVAISGNNVAGVICCGAGLPGGEDNFKTKFDYFGLVGNQDFNLTELIRLDLSLAKSGFNNELLVFDGKHAWPTVEQMYEAFLWLELNAIKKQNAPKNENLISETATYFDKEIKNLEKEEKIFDAFNAADRAIHFLTGLGNVSDFESRSKILLSDLRYQQQFEKKVTIMQEEMGEQNKLLSSFTTMDAAWWAETVNQLNKPVADIERQNMNRRLVAWLGLVAYLSSNNALKKGQTDVAGQFLDIYTTLEPLNPEHAYLGAILQMQLKKPNFAIEQLKQALFLGFRDIQRIAQDTAFVALHSRNDFKNLLKGGQ